MVLDPSGRPVQPPAPEKRSWWRQETVLSAALLAMNTLVIGWIISSSYDIGSIKASLAATQELQRQMRDDDATTASALTKIGERLEAIDLRLTQDETNPAKLLAELGVPWREEFIGGFIEGRPIVFPRKVESIQVLLDNGFEEVELAPFLNGFSFAVAEPPPQ